MYCISCGVKLADSEKKCPLCGTIPVHPDFPRTLSEGQYPPDRRPELKVSHWGFLWIVTSFWVVSFLTSLLCDLQLNDRITWSGYVMGALITSYVAAILPLWFKHPNPVVLVPCCFGAVGLYLLYISLETQGNWFLSFALPLVGFLGLLTTAVITLTRYIRRGRLYIYGGGMIITGLFMPVLEFLINLTFMPWRHLLWSYFPLGALVLVGGFLIFLGICKPARETMTRKFFI